MKRCVGLILTGLVMAAVLAGCGCWNGEAEVVFVNCTDTPVAAVGIGSSVGQYADNSPLGRGDWIGFDEVEYPATVTAYRDAAGRFPLAECVLEAPPEGERWYVAAENGPEGLALTPVGQWPMD